MTDKFNKLVIGDKVGVFLPSSPVKEEFRSKGLSEIRELGFIPIEVDNILSDNGYVGKNPEEIVDDLNGFFNDNSIKAIWAARGGYGSNLILNHLDSFTNINPKIIIGSSDVSYILWKFMEVPGMVTLYGPMVFSSMAKQTYDRENLFKVLTGGYDELRIDGKVLIDGKVNKVITGGCLSNLSSLCGTKFMPLTNDRIILIEDVNERPYRLDRMIWQLSQSGVFSGAGGVVFGEFPGCFNDKDEKISFYSTVKKYFNDYDFPIIYDIPFGHSANQKTLPLGNKVTIDTDSYNGIIIKGRV